MSDDTLDIETGENLTAVNYKITPAAKQALVDYAKEFKLPLRDALSHILVSLSKDHSVIPKPTQYGVKFELGNTGDRVTIATCETCKDGFSPVEHGTSVEALMEWVESHKHGKKG